MTDPDHDADEAQDLAELVDEAVEEALSSRGIPATTQAEVRRLNCLQNALSFYHSREGSGAADVLAAAQLFEQFLLGDKETSNHVH